jgi:hypothetical protein
MVELRYVTTLELKCLYAIVNRIKYTFVAECVVEGTGWLENQMDDFAHVQMEMQTSINSQTSMMHDLFGHLKINPDE